MDPVLSLIAALSTFALLSAGVSLFLHWIRPSEPTTAEVARELQAMRLAHADLVDRVEQWQKRDRVRRLREGKEAADIPDLDSLSPHERKAHLRRQFLGGTT